MEAWHFDYINDETDQITTEQLLASGALLMGRKTYEAYAAVWPQHDGVYPTRTSPASAAISDMLFSEGNNTRLELIGTRTFNNGIVMLSYQVPGR